MELKLVRGIAADLKPADKQGRVLCRIGEVTVRLHRDLSTAVKAGDEALIGGELNNDVVDAYALRNFTQRRMYKIDFTNHILGFGVGGVLMFFGMVYLGQATAITFTGSMVMNFTLLTVGSTIVFFTLKRVPRIIKLSGWVEDVRE